MGAYRDVFSLSGRIAIVTGGQGLIGREIVKALADSGARVYVADVQKNGQPLPPRAAFVDCDVSREASVRGLFRKVASRAGRPDIVVNCAYPRTPDWNTPVGSVKFSSWKRNVDAHLGGYFLVSREACEVMKPKGGSVINLASIYGVCAPDFSLYEGQPFTMPAAYSAIKGGIVTFSKYLASYYGRYNVRVNSISPGGIRDRQPASFVRKYCRRTLLGRMGIPADVAAAAVFLASGASAYITGVNLCVDGGWTAR